MDGTGPESFGAPGDVALVSGVPSGSSLLDSGVAERWCGCGVVGGWSGPKSHACAAAGLPLAKE